jgi:hypothetical protein
MLDAVWLDPEAFSQAIHAKGCPLTQCWGFIDGTAKSISRPIYNQKIMYSGHKRIHCLKFQVFLKPFYGCISPYNTAICFKFTLSNADLERD